MISHLNFNMYTSVWVKYIPVIRIVLKKSLVSEQTLVLNVPDFRRAGMTRKSGYKFQIVLKNGRPANVIVDFPIAAGLVTALLSDEVTNALCATNEFHFSLSPAFELTIKHIPHSESAKESLLQSENVPVLA